jgi:hypothetical protein
MTPGTRVRHYHVGQNIPGYLPMDDDPPMFTDRRSAVRYASERARELVEDDREGDPEYARNRRKSGSDGDYYVVGDGHDLGIHVWTVDCAETDCEAER